MPILSSFLDLPEAPSSGEALFGSSQPQQSVFAQPGQDRRNEIRGSIFTPKNQKKLDVLTRFQAYQSMMRKEQERLQTDEHAARATSELSKLNPRDPMFPDAVAQVVGQYPLAANHESVRGLLETQSMAFKDQRFREERKLNQEKEVLDAVEQRPDLAALYDNELRVSGEEGAKRRVYQQLFNDKQHAAIVEANPDITEAELDALRNPAGMFDTTKVSRVIGQAKQRGEQQRGLAKISALRIKAADPALDPDQKAVIDSEIAAYQQAYGTGNAQAANPSSGAAPLEFRVTAKTTRAEIEKLPSGTRVVLPDGTSKIKK